MAKKETTKAKTKKAPAKAKAKKAPEVEAPQVDLDQSQSELAEKLTRLQRRFVLFLVGSDMSQRQAYLAAGGQAKAEKTQDVNASRMLADAKVKAFYDSLLNQAQTDAVMTKAEALERLSKQARIKITDILTFDYIEVTDAEGEREIQTVWHMKPAKDIDPDVAACIKSVTFGKSGPKIELYDSNATIKLMADLLGWNAPKMLDHKSTDGSMSPDGLTQEQRKNRIAELQRKIKEAD